MLADTQETREFCEFLEEEKLADVKEEIDNFLANYRPKPGSLIPALQRTQEILGYLPPVVQNYIAQVLNVPPCDVFGVVSFYSFFTMKPRGEHVTRICLGTACYVKGGDKICKKLQKELGVDPGETTKDRQFTLEIVRCLGACGLAPVVVIDENTYGQITPDESVKLINSYANSTNPK